MQNNSGYYLLASLQLKPERLSGSQSQVPKLGLFVLEGDSPGLGVGLWRRVGIVRPPENTRLLEEKSLLSI